MSGAWWGGTDNFSFIEEKHETGYCLELNASKRAVTPIRKDENGRFNFQWEDCSILIDRITVPQAEDLADHLSAWVKNMRVQELRRII